MAYRTLTLVALAAFALACKKSGQAASKPAEPAVENAATKYADQLQNDVTKAQAAQAKADAAIQQTTQAVGQATEEPSQ